MAAPGRNEYRFTGRNHPGRPLGMDRHGARAGVKKLMPIVLVRRDEVPTAVAACKRADGQEWFLLHSQPLARLRHFLSI